MKKTVLFFLSLYITALSIGKDNNKEGVIKRDTTGWFGKMINNYFLLEKNQPVRYYSNILLQIEGNPTHLDSVIVKKEVENLYVNISKWKVYLVKSAAPNLVIVINSSGTVKDSSKIAEQRIRGNEIIKTTLHLNIPPDADSLQRAKIIRYYLYRSIIKYKPDSTLQDLIPGSVFSVVNPEHITFRFADLWIIKAVYSEKYEFELMTRVVNDSWFEMVLFSLIATILSISFLIWLLNKGMFNNHYFRFGSYFRQGFLVMIVYFLFIIITILPVFFTMPVAPAPRSFVILVTIGLSLVIWLFFGSLAVIVLYFSEKLVTAEEDSLFSRVIYPLLTTTIIPSIIILGIYTLLKPEQSPIDLLTVTIYAVSFTSLFAIGRSLYLFMKLKSDHIIRKKDVELARLGELHKQAELQSLRSKINPHFLYNSLNSIASLASTDAAKTEKMALALSDFFRYAINREQKQLNSLSEELNAIGTYLEIEKVRFGDRLNYEIVCPDHLLNIQIPQLLIQPIVENAIKHGISKLTENGVVKIEILSQGKRLVIRVFDNGPDFPEGPIGGYGIKNTMERLSILYGERAKINWENGEAKHIEISIPL